MNSDKLKIYAVVSVLVLCVGWLVYYIVSSSRGGYGSPQPLVTPAWTDANEINKKLAEDRRFADVALSVVSETPRKYKIVGLVHSSSDMTALKELLSREAGEAELEFEVNLPK